MYVLLSFKIVHLCSKGITSNTLWAALVDLSKIYQVSEETINYLATFSSLGYLIGSLSKLLTEKSLAMYIQIFSSIY